MPRDGKDETSPRGMWRRDQFLRSGPRPDTRFEHSRERAASRQMSRMQWRAAGAQFYPGGAYEQLLEISHRGRGPKGYQRSDELLRELICERLTDDPYIDASNICVEVKDGEVTLTGTVEVRRQKHATEDLVAEVAGVAQIHNRITAANPDLDEGGADESID